MTCGCERATETDMFTVLYEYPAIAFGDLVVATAAQEAGIDSYHGSGFCLSLVVVSLQGISIVSQVATGHARSPGYDG